MSGPTGTGTASPLAGSGAFDAFRGRGGGGAMTTGRWGSTASLTSGMTGQVGSPGGLLQSYGRGVSSQFGSPSNVFSSGMAGGVAGTAATSSSLGSGGGGGGVNAMGGSWGGDGAGASAAFNWTPRYTRAPQTPTVPAPPPTSPATRRPSGARGGGGTPLAPNVGLSNPPPVSSSLTPVPRPRHVDPPLDLVPPFRFAMVEEGVYRGAYPTLRNFPFLQQLHLRTIVSLTPEEPTYDLARFAEAHNIRLRHIQAERFKGEAQLLPNDLNDALQTIIDLNQHPVYVHCLDGRYVTGLVMMALRKLQQWDGAASHDEYVRFTKDVQDEVAFIAEYTGVLTLPLRIPPWLWGGSWMDDHGRPKRLSTAIKVRYPSRTTLAGGEARHLAGSRPGDRGHLAAVDGNSSGSPLDALGSGGSPRLSSSPLAATVGAAARAAHLAGGGEYIDVEGVAPLFVFGSEHRREALSAAATTNTPHDGSLSPQPPSAASRATAGAAGGLGGGGSVGNSTSTSANASMAAPSGATVVAGASAAAALSSFGPAAVSPTSKGSRLEWEEHTYLLGQGTAAAAAAAAGAYTTAGVTSGIAFDTRCLPADIRAFSLRASVEVDAFRPRLFPTPSASPFQGGPAMRAGMAGGTSPPSSLAPEVVSHGGHTHRSLSASLHHQQQHPPAPLVSSGSGGSHSTSLRSPHAGAAPSSAPPTSAAAATTGAMDVAQPPSSLNPAALSSTASSGGGGVGLAVPAGGGGLPSPSLSATAAGVVNASSAGVASLSSAVTATTVVVPGSGAGRISPRKEVTTATDVTPRSKRVKRRSSV